MSAAGKHSHRARGATLILAMIFVLVLSALAVSLASLSGTNVQVAANQCRVSSALYAAQSGLECAKYIVNTAIRKSEILGYRYQLEDLDNNDNPKFTFGQTVYDADGDPVSGTIGTIDSNLLMTDSDGNPVFDENGERIPVDYNNRVHSYADELQGYHENVQYWGPDGYDDYKSGSLTLTRAVHEDQTFTDAYFAANQNALFRNCTFEGVLYVDCDQTSQTSGTCNNVRFENCTFNGVIVTNTPDDLSWQRNALYFTGAATFNNTSDIQEATILAPHFNVDLGNTNRERSDNNVLTGAIVGGIVDIRGNAQIYGTVISRCDTSRWTSGFVTNIGATLDDGGSETTDLGDIGVISITPEADMMLPSGITSPIIIKPDLNTYSESV